MTDLEISEALALAIGWKVKEKHGNCYVHYGKALWRYFDYRDWAVIGPIAEKFDAFPCKATAPSAGEWFAAPDVYADIPQKAIALAVIGAKR